MSARPTPRRSSLAGATPITPPEQSQPATSAAPAPRTVSEPVAARPAVPTPKPARAEGENKYPPKVSFYQDPDRTARVRGAILHTQASEGTRSMSEFIDRAVMKEVERLERQYNNGEEFPRIYSRGLPQGRPLGS